MQELNCSQGVAHEHDHFLAPILSLRCAGPLAVDALRTLDSLEHEGVGQSPRLASFER